MLLRYAPNIYRLIEFFDDPFLFQTANFSLKVLCVKKTESEGLILRFWASFNRHSNHLFENFRSRLFFMHFVTCNNY